MCKMIHIIVSSLILCASTTYADIKRVSVSSTGEQANGSSSFLVAGEDLRPSTSSDGRFVAFHSSSSNLVNGDTNNSDDIFIRDIQSGTVERVSVSSTGEQANDHSFLSSMSANGRFVAFHSSASNLVVGDVNDREDIFVRDLQTGTTERVSLSSAGVQANGNSNRPSISADGLFVAFHSYANNLVAGDTNGKDDIFVRDRIGGTTERVNLSSTGIQANGSSTRPSISANGRFVSFESRASTLVVGDINNSNPDIFVHDRVTRDTERVSVSTTGEQANHLSIRPAISADGRFVAFQSIASNLVAGDTNNTHDVFIHDRVTGGTQRVSVTSGGAQINAGSYFPSMSADGRFVAFQGGTSGTNFSDPNYGNVFIHDRSTMGIAQINVPINGEQRDDISYSPSMSADGDFVAFFSKATNLVNADTNGRDDAFIAVNTLLTSDNNFVTIEKLINNQRRETPSAAAKLSAGTQYRQSYKVTNNTPNRIYQVQVFEGSNPVCDFYALNSGESRLRCDSFQTALEGDQHVQVKVTAKVSGTSKILTGNTDAYYTGFNNVTGELRVTHRVNNINADDVDQAQTLGPQQATVLFKIENTGEIELYQVKTYHDPVSPVNSGWALQCVVGAMKPGQVRYCKRDITFTESGLNETMGRVQGRNAIRSATNVVNALNPTYFIVP